MRAYELFENTNNVLYHTTSKANALEIINTGVIKPKNNESFVSFSKKPFKGDISHNEVTLKINYADVASQVMPVEYTQSWYYKHPEQSSYIAGEGWKEQFVVPDMCYDDEYGEEDPECVDRFWEQAELDSFLAKDNEEEVISKNIGEPVQIKHAEFVDN